MVSKAGHVETLFDGSTIRAVIGLGNPGAKYSKTRHNIGFRIVEALAEQANAVWQITDKMEVAQASVTAKGGVASMYFIKPLTFMNESGKVMAFLAKKGIQPSQIVVVHDELEKPFENISIRFGGSAKGHNGLRSIMGIVGADFWRLRFGIGRPVNKDEVGDYVLKPFSSQEEQKMDYLIDQACRLIIG
ncbi:aminoacyl-tRNA hydrolase [bacterium]|nr:MAG: aminoacyl-tRNA hydrolase [bacterium]